MFALYSRGSTTDALSVPEYNGTSETRQTSGDTYRNRTLGYNSSVVSAVTTSTDGILGMPAMQQKMTWNMQNQSQGNMEMLVRTS